jgi:hypothetical protein
VGALLAEGKVTAQHGESGFSEGSCHSDEKWRLAVGPSTVGKHQRITAWSRWTMEEPPHAGVRVFFETLHTFWILELDFGFKKPSALSRQQRALL